MRSRQRWIVFVVALVTGGGVWSCRGPAGAPPAASSQPPPASGSGPAPQGDQIVPFTIHVPDEVLADLKDRLARTRLPDAIDGSGWT